MKRCSVVCVACCVLYVVLYVARCAFCCCGALKCVPNQTKAHGLAKLGQITALQSTTERAHESAFGSTDHMRCCGAAVCAARCSCTVMLFATHRTSGECGCDRSGVDVTGDGVSELVVVTAGGIHILQYDLNVVRERFRPPVPVSP
jgi:hypothetical protein